MPTRRFDESIQRNKMTERANEMNYTTTKAMRFVSALAAALIVGFSSVSCAEDEADKSGQSGDASVETAKRDHLDAMEQAVTTSKAMTTKVDDAGKAGARQSKSSALERISEIRALAKESADDDDNVDFFGFFVGMSYHDAAELAKWYKLKSEEFDVFSVYENAVWRLQFSLKGVRRITKGGSTFKKLAQEVANRVGAFEYNYKREMYEYKTIDGIVVSMSETEGVVITCDNLKPKEPKETAAAKSERLAVIQKVIPELLANMVPIPGKDFKLGKYEVTQLQWWRVMCNAPSHFNGANKPVERVSWDDCHEFLKKLNDMPEVKASGLVFRLPSEAEWEYACRAGATGEYCKLADGTEITKNKLDDVAWFDDNSGGKTHPVGQKKPNAFGLYDMHGNVWEWCEDLYRAGDSDRVRRGGGWNNGARYCTAGYRGYDFPDDRYDSLSFRLAASQEVNR